MLILGVTGNIGCGKSSLSNIFQKNGIEVIDADIIARQIFEDSSILEKVFNTFGESIKNNDGSLNRKELGNIVFNNHDKIIQLNNLTHPQIKKNIVGKINEARENKKEVIIVDGALLIEAKYLDIIDKLIVVTCNRDLQITRVKKRDNCTEIECMNKISSQMKQEDKVQYADYEINNSGDFEELEIKANKFIQYMRENWYE